MSTQTIALGGVIAIALAGTGMYMAKNRIEICHVTDDEAKPWNVIMVSERSWPAHEAHGDKYPVPAGGCETVEGPPPPPGEEF